MDPFKDFGVTLLDRPQDEVTSVTPSSTVLIDAHRQGVEVSMIKYFLRSNLPLITSKGLSRTTINGKLTPVLDMRDLGQGIEINAFEKFEDASERIDAQTILSNNLIYEDAQDPFVSITTNDGRISVFSDSGKLSLVNQAQSLNARGIRGQVDSIALSDVFKFKERAILAFEDGVGQDLTIPVPGYAGINITNLAFNDVTYETNLDIPIEYTYIGPDSKTFSRGSTYYGSPTGTDSVAFGGLLR
jgi:hypothetical protein